MVARSAQPRHPHPPHPHRSCARTHGTHRTRHIFILFPRRSLPSPPLSPLTPNRVGILRPPSPDPREAALTEHSVDSSNSHSLDLSLFPRRPAPPSLLGLRTSARLPRILRDRIVYPSPSHLTPYIALAARLASKLKRTAQRLAPARPCPYASLAFCSPSLGCRLPCRCVAASFSRLFTCAERLFVSTCDLFSSAS